MSSGFTLKKLDISPRGLVGR